MKIQHFFTMALLQLSLIISTTSLQASENVIIVKGGTYSFGDTTQIVDTFPSNVSATFETEGGLTGIEYDHVFEHFSIGGGIEKYSLNYTTSQGGSGTVDVSHLMFNGKYYFLDSAFKPFVGASAGVAITDFTGSVIGNSAGLAVAVSAGFRYQFSVVGLYVEYKNYVLADTEDSFDSEVDVAGDGVFGGISFSF